MKSNSTVSFSSGPEEVAAFAYKAGQLQKDKDRWTFKPEVVKRAKDGTDKPEVYVPSRDSSGKPPNGEGCSNQPDGFPKKNWGRLHENIWLHENILTKSYIYAMA